MFKRALAVFALAISLLLVGQASSGAREVINRITLPAVIHHDAYCLERTVHLELPASYYARPVSHVTYSVAKTSSGNKVKYVVTAHTTTKNDRWPVDAAPGPGWVRVTRRTATSTFTLDTSGGC